MHHQFEVLTPEDWERFRRICQYQLFRFAQLDAADLVQDVAMRFLTLERKWPIGLPFKVVFYNALRSVADDYRNGEMSRPYMTEADLAPADDGTPQTVEHLANDHRTPEDALEAEQLIGWIFAQFKEDPDVEAVIMGRLERFSAEETQANFVMSADKYHAARKRFERWLSRHKEILEKP